MYQKILIFFFSIALLLNSCKPKTSDSDTQVIADAPQFVANKDMIAVIYTSKGKIEIGLEYMRAPLTVANFVALAEGKMKNVHRPLGKPYYDGLKFHRVIPDFMAQGGCPSGNGTGNAGYLFSDEFHPELLHDAPGVLSMANSGPNSNSSQFFITHKSTPWLDGVHSVFGKVISGLDVLMKIENNDVIDSIRIVRNSSEAKGFDAPLVFEMQKKIIEQKKLVAISEKYAAFQNNELYKTYEAYVKKNFPGATKTASGMYFVKQNSTEGEAPTAGSNVKVHYRGKHIDGKVFDESYGKSAFNFQLGKGMVIPGWDEGIALLKTGEKATLIIPYYLGYGEMGMPPVIQPNETLVFDVELLDIQ